ncbi:hypothetical protein HOU02_gp189 [Caulobacter phage CcrBL9]|uniref:Uncharacterized protein n=1 Tax=Caulobacter phage CcrBL9 TaxID=2283270 RepID=A0A385ECX7_9CAUD|nr:hypothetical protein HOU02_gp189 [Caulobacter phage CcrBL9]AXQ69536.1 hypothetical protein CcrBL9_gp512 [Caulobacter phage CcrBL9]
MTRATDEMLKLAAEIEEAEARLSAATDYWADRQKDYLNATEETDDAKVLADIQLKALVAYEQVVDAIAFRGVMTVQLRRLQKARSDQITRRGQARKRMGGADDREAA